MSDQQQTEKRRSKQLELPEQALSLFRSLLDRVRRCSLAYGLFASGDKVAVAVSGGKDSICLVALLGSLARKIGFSLTAFHVAFPKVGYSIDVEKLKTHCETFGVPLHILVDEEFTVSAPSNPPNDIEDCETTTNRLSTKSACMCCSRARRRLLFAAAKAHSCTKIAFGHHQDDCIETLLMNMTLHGTIATIPPQLLLKKHQLVLVRPMCTIGESELSKLALFFPKMGLTSCPHERESTRALAKGLVTELEKINPFCRQNVWASMENIKSEYLPKKIAKMTKRQRGAERDELQKKRVRLEKPEAEVLAE